MKVDTANISRKHLTFLSKILSLARKSAAPAMWPTLSYQALWGSGEESFHPCVCILLECFTMSLKTKSTYSSGSSWRPSPQYLGLPDRFQWRLLGLRILWRQSPSRCAVAPLNKCPLRVLRRSLPDEPTFHPLLVASGCSLICSTSTTASTPKGLLWGFKQLS